MKGHERKGDVQDQGMTDTNTIGIKNTMVRRSELALQTTNTEVPGSIPGHSLGFF
jgi:hypothetical protein